MKKVIVGILLVGTFILTGCDDRDSPRYKASAEEQVPSYLQTYVVEADGLSYRCFDTSSQGGGLWCTERSR